MSSVRTWRMLEAAGRARIWLAWTMVTIGTAAAALCGGVSLFLGMAIFLSNDMSDPSNVRWLLYYVLLGGVPAVVGLGVMGVGVVLLRQKRS